MESKSSRLDMFDRRPGLKRTRLRESQINLFVLLARELQDAWRRAPHLPMSSRPEYRRFIDGAYACAFVTNDFSNDGRLAGGVSYERVQDNPRILQDCTLQTIRHVAHTLVRADHWNSQATDDEEVGVINRALASGLVTEVANRLDAIRQAAPFD